MPSPNIIVFFTDQQRWDTVGLNGNPLGLTPNFDRIAGGGTHVRYAFTPQPVCGPARACLQTGRYASANGCIHNGIAHPENATTLAKCFASAGYETAYIGKWHLGGTGSEPVPPAGRGGYQYWLAADALEFVSDAYDTHLHDGSGRLVKLPGYRVDAMTDAAIRYIDQSKDKPFFLMLSFLEPHHQNHRDDHPAPVGYAQRYDGRWTPPDLAAIVSEATGLVGGNAQQNLGGYLGMVKRLDECFGRLEDALLSLNLLDNTVIVFASDHGSHFKTRNNEYKRSPHESSIRVPMALSGPGFDGGGDLRQLVSLVDLAPTLLDAAGMAIPSTMQGRSILPLLRRQYAEWPDDIFVQISESHVGRAIRTHRWKYAVVAPGVSPSSAGADRYQESNLYDLQSDPHELNNLIGLGSHDAVVVRVRQRLLARMKQAGETTPTIEPAPSRPGGQRFVTAREVDQ